MILTHYIYQLCAAIFFIFLALILLIGGLCAAASENIWVRCRECDYWFNDEGETQADCPIICSHPMLGICPACLAAQEREMERLKL